MLDDKYVVLAYKKLRRRKERTGKKRWRERRLGCACFS